jgi:hypothetical protein
MEIRDFLKKGIFPIVAMLLLGMMFYPFCLEHGVCDFRKLWIFVGIPFGVRRMYVWMIPRGWDIGSSMGMFAFQLLIGGVIGSIVVIIQFMIALFYVGKGIILAIMCITRKLVKS